jgi:3-hydroxyisobutyrate dehydrogenase
MKLGFIGLGSIGNPMAANLVRAGHHLTVHDLARERAQNLLARGARWAASPRATAEAAEVLFTSLPGPAQIRDVIEGERGVAAIEAPVTGGVANAYAGKLSIFVGGAPEAYARAKPLLDALGDKVMHLGPIGSASVAKLITNLMCFVHEIALGEGLVLGTRLGLDPIQLWEAIKVSYADSFVARVDGPDIFDGNYGANFSIALACKDIGLSLGLAREAGLKLEAAELIERLYNAARARYGEAAGCLSAVRDIEARSGVSLPRKLAGGP